MNSYLVRADAENCGQVGAGTALEAITLWLTAQNIVDSPQVTLYAVDVFASVETNGRVYSAHRI